MQGVRYLGIRVKCLRLYLSCFLLKKHMMQQEGKTLAVATMITMVMVYSCQAKKGRAGLVPSMGHAASWDQYPLCLLCACSCHSKGRVSASVMCVNVQLTEVLQEEPWQTNTIFDKLTYPLSFVNKVLPKCKLINQEFSSFHKQLLIF